MEYTKSHKSSTQPRKQRAYRNTAPPHVQGKFMNVHLSTDLHKKYKARSMRIRVGDTVKVLRGDFKGKSGKVERVNIRDEKVYIAGIDVPKRDGSKALRPIKPSNLLLEQVHDTDKRRFKKWSKTTSKD